MHILVNVTHILIIVMHILELSRNITVQFGGMAVLQEPIGKMSTCEFSGDDHPHDQLASGRRRGGHHLHCRQRQGEHRLLFSQVFRGGRARHR